MRVFFKIGLFSVHNSNVHNFKVIGNTPEMCNKVLSVCVSCTPAVSVYCFRQCVTFLPLLFLDHGETKMLSDAVRFKTLTIWAPMVAAVLASLHSALMQPKNCTFCHYRLKSFAVRKSIKTILSHKYRYTPNKSPFYFSTGITPEQVFSVK